MTANPADAVREALERLRSFLCAASYSDGSDPLDDLDTLAALTARVAELEDEKAAIFLRAKEWAFQCGQAEAKADRLAALAGAAPVENFRGESLPVARQQIVNALVASKGWLYGYAEAYVDEFAAMATPHAPAKAREVTEADVALAIGAHDAYWEAQLQPCSRCAGKGHHNGFGEDGHDPDWCGACGGSGITSAGSDEDAMRAALATFAEGA